MLKCFLEPLVWIYSLLFNSLTTKCALVNYFLKKKKALDFTQHLEMKRIKMHWITTTQTTTVWHRSKHVEIAFEFMTLKTCIVPNLWNKATHAAACSDAACCITFIIIYSCLFMLSQFQILNPWLSSQANIPLSWQKSRSSSLFYTMTEWVYRRIVILM